MIIRANLSVRAIIMSLLYAFPVLIEIHQTRSCYGRAAQIRMVNFKLSFKRIKPSQMQLVLVPKKNEFKASMTEWLSRLIFTRSLRSSNKIQKNFYKLNHHYTEKKTSSYGISHQDAIAVLENSSNRSSNCGTSTV